MNPDTEEKSEGDILVIDDEQFNRSILAGMLKVEGFEVREASSGNLAMKLVNARVPDLILLDIMMPEMDGFEACRKLREEKRTRDVPVIFISALDDVESKVRAFAEGGTDYITKPFRREEVLARVKTRIALRNMRKRLEEKNLRLRREIVRRERINRELQSIRENLEIRIRERTADLTVANEKLLEEIAERKIAERKMRTSEARYRELFENMKSGVAIYSAVGDGEDFIILDFNSAAEKIDKIRAEDVIGRSIQQIFPGVRDFGLLDVLKQVYRTGKSEHLPAGAYHDDRIAGWRENFVYKLPSGEIVTIYDDVTEKKRDEEKIRRAYRELDQIFNSARGGMCLLDMDLNIVRINRTLTDMFEWDESNVAGGNFFDMIPEDDADFRSLSGNPDFRPDKRIEYELSINRRGKGKGIFNMKCTPFYDVEDNLKGYLWTVTEITKRVMAEKAAKIKERQLIHADKLAAIGTLVSGVAHEINNPNGIITLNVPMLFNFWKSAEPILDKYYEAHGDFKMGGAPFSKIKERAPYLFGQTIESAKRIKRIVNELKNFARQDAADMSENLDINDVIRTAVSLVRNKIGKSTNSFEVSLFSRPLFVTGNFQRLEQVFINVLINACEALTDFSQSISVSVGNDEKKGLAIVEVRDEGKGIREDELSHVFEPFYTTRRDIGGTGLGLSVSHGIITEHNGEIDYLPKPGCGALCRISLPLSVSTASVPNKDL